MAKNSGWVKLYRSLLEDPLWTSEPFTKGQAWADLILMVNHESAVGKKGTVIPVGSMVTSYATLAKRWKWSTSKVRRYLGTLTDTHMVTLTGTRSGTLLSLVNYEKYQGVRHTSRHTNRHTDEHTDEQPTRNKEYKEEKNSRSRSNSTRNKTQAEKMAAIEERRQKLLAKEAQQNDGS